MIRLMEGRIRVRDGKLKDRRIAGELEKELHAVGGIGEIRYNRRTGSLLIFFDTAVADRKSILRHIEETVGGSLPAGGLPNRKRADGGTLLPHFSVISRRACTGGMAASLAVSLLGVAAGGAKLHAAAGIVFIALLGAHMYRHNKTLFA